MPLSEAEKWLDHLGSCSPCYSDFSRLQVADRNRRTRTVLAVAASILIVALVAGWAFLHKRNENLLAQTVTVDLRDRSVARGTEPNPNGQPLEFPRTAANLIILLPLGSSEGVYEIRIAGLSGEPRVETNGTATFNDHTLSLRVAVNLASLGRGKYLLQIRRAEQDWESYSVVLR
jgi:hypothetical protein